MASVTIVFGWWLVPTVISILVAIAAFWPVQDDCYGILSVGKFLLGVIVVLATWLVYLLCTHVTLVFH